MTRWKCFQLIAVLFIPLLIIGCERGPSTPTPTSVQDDPSLVQDMALKLAFILQTQVRDETITPNMITFLEAEEYAHLSDATGRKFFRQAYEQSIAALDEPNGQGKGALIGEGFFFVFQACVHYRLPDCQKYDGKMPQLTGAELMLEVFSVIEPLAKKGEIICAEPPSTPALTQSPNGEIITPEGWERRQIGETDLSATIPPILVSFVDDERISAYVTADDEANIEIVVIGLPSDDLLGQIDNSDKSLLRFGQLALVVSDRMPDWDDITPVGEFEFSDRSTGYYVQVTSEEDEENVSYFGLFDMQGVLSFVSYTRPVEGAKQDDDTIILGGLASTIANEHEMLDPEMLRRFVSP